MADTKYKVSRFMTDAILQKVTQLGVAPNQLVANLARSGQLGTGIRFTKLDGATPAVLSPVVIVILSMPSMMDQYPKLQEMLMAMMETHAKSFTGIDFGYTLETQDTIVGHDSQTMKVPTRTTRSAVNPTMTIQEYPGFPVYNAFRQWQRLIKDPDTGFSALPAELAGNNDMDEEAIGGIIPAWYMSSYSASFIAIQYDPSGLPDRIYDAAIYTNVFPTEIGEIGFERTIGTHQLKERSINFSAIVQHNENTRELGYRVAQYLALHKINYNYALPGLAGSVDLDEVYQDTEIKNFGGMGYESGSTDVVEGARQQFQPFTANSWSDFEDRHPQDNSSPEKIDATGAAERS